MSYPIKRECMYCDKDMGTMPGGTTPGQVSHGICDKCNALSDDERDEIADRKTGSKNAKPIRTFKDFLK